MFRNGIVQQQDVPNCRVRVVFHERNQMQSWWLPILRWGSQYDKDFWIPDLGEQVVCFMDEHDEEGCVLGTIFSQVDTTPNGMTVDKRHLTAKDSAVFEYDRNSHTLTVNIPPSSSAINITVNGPANLTASNSSINLSAPNGNITLKTDEHNNSVNGIIDTYNGHTHPDPQGGSTGAPAQQMS
jgi:phage baseplate assembly protein V